jgi:hypothetical protein
MKSQDNHPLLQNNGAGRREAENAHHQIAVQCLDRVNLSLFLHLYSVGTSQSRICQAMQIDHNEFNYLAMLNCKRG